MNRRGAFIAAAVLGAAVLLALATPRLITALAGGALSGAARARHTSLSWTGLQWRAPLGVGLTGLTVSDARGATVAAAESLTVTLDLWSLLALHPRPHTLEIAHAHVRASSGGGADADTLAPEEEAPASRGHAPDRSARVREAARGVVHALLIPARKLPRLEVRDLDVFGREDPTGLLHLDQLTLREQAGAAHLEGRGMLRSGGRVPFAFDARYDAADRLTAQARFQFDAPDGGPPEALSLAVTGRVQQDRRGGRILLGDSTRIEIGRVALRLAGVLTRDEPRFTLALAAGNLSAGRCRESAPRALLGPLSDLAVTGTFDYAASIDLDFSRPDSVAFEAHVTPHGLALDRTRTRLAIATLEQPFTARIHLPHDRIETREMSSANPHFLALGEIDSTLVHAVLANEDGGFFQHHGFNLPAVRRSIADNIHAAAWRRGAGTITMQLVRNLFLGHERTLSRKAQEVILAWVLEHLSGVSKARMLEIYLNIVEWSPESCGADEAAHYYFGHGARELSVPEALFLATVLPAPGKWRWRFNPDGSLRPFEQAQMHFIGRAMVARGWLDAARLPAADSLGVELRGEARRLLARPGLSAALDSLRSLDRGVSPAGGPASP